jgi:predicted dehydrogenase
MVGLGSIGKRHLKNLYGVLSKKNVRFYIDALRSKKTNESDVSEFIHEEYYSYDDLSDDYDIAFVTNPTNLHYDTIQRLLPKARHLFIEKPVFDRTDCDISQLQLKKEGVYYVACPLRFSSVIKYLKEFVSKNNIYSAGCLCSSYLPDWRPGTDYKKNYSANSDAGGGVRIDLIHEWDYLQYLFGVPLEIAEFHGKYSQLEIASDDTAVYIARYKDKLVSVHLDYYGRVDRREIELYLEHDVIVGDLINHTVRFLKSGELVDLPQDRDDMQTSELEHFLNIIDGRSKISNDILTAFKTLNIAYGRIL